jgi:hypothetical protein
MEQYLQQNAWLLALVILWTLPWKAVTLWKAARLKQKVWFVILLCVNSMALLEIIYIFLVTRKREKHA